MPELRTPPNTGPWERWLTGRTKTRIARWAWTRGNDDQVRQPRLGPHQRPRRRHASGPSGDLRPGAARRGQQALGGRTRDDVRGDPTRHIDHQVWFSTQKFPRRGRFADVCVDGIAHESKVGLVGFSTVIQKQIEKDAFLIKNQAITGAHWNFFASATSSSIGADPRVIDPLLEKGIPFTIHVP